MEKFQPKKEELELTEHAGIPGHELELPLHTPPAPEIINDIEKKKITPEALEDLIKHPEKQWDQDDKRDNKDTPTIH